MTHLDPRHWPQGTESKSETIEVGEGFGIWRATSRINPWTRRQVMSAADANIEVCGGTFVQMQSDNGGTNEEARLEFNQFDFID